MTGQKDRYTTTEKLWKLDDQTLSTPKHDEMVLWLLNKDNVNSILPSYDTNYSMRFKSHFDPDATQNNHHFSKNLFEAVGNIWDVLNQKLDHGLNVQDVFKDEYDTIWSKMIEDYHKCECFEISTHNVEIKSEVPITANNGFLVGYCDVVVSIILPNLYKGNYFEIINNNQSHNTLTRYIEVKPVIKSFGETLRQLNTYKHYLHTEEMYLFTTDLRFKEAFESQGIKVLTYPSQ